MPTSGTTECDGPLSAGLVVREAPELEEAVMPSKERVLREALRLLAEY